MKLPPIPPGDNPAAGYLPDPPGARLLPIYRHYDHGLLLAGGHAGEGTNVEDIKA